MTIETPAGTLYIDHQNGALKEISTTPLPGIDAPENPKIRKELEGYFHGKLRKFTLPVELHGTPFQKRVWEALRQIPWGETRTYGEIALQVGKPGGARAVGQAVGKNPLLIVVPCHRVVAADGLGGFSSGIETKIKLLRLEGSFQD